jgi:hypothetical protein
MTISRRLLHHHISGREGNDDWYYLCRDNETGHVFVEHEWDHVDYSGRTHDRHPFELGDFLTNSGSTAKSRLMDLIGTLLPE